MKKTPGFCLFCTWTFVWANREQVREPLLLFGGLVYSKQIDLERSAGCCFICESLASTCSYGRGRWNSAHWDSGWESLCEVLFVAARFHSSARSKRNKSGDYVTWNFFRGHIKKLKVQLFLTDLFTPNSHLVPLLQTLILPLDDTACPTL